MSNRIIFAVLAGAILLSSSTVFAEPNLVSYWAFDEGSGTTANDSAGSNDGTLANGPVWTSGQIGNALSFDGTDDYVNMGAPADGSLDFGASDSFTLSLWFKRDVIDVDHTLISKREVVSGVHNEGYSWRISNNNLNANIEGTNTAGTVITGSTTLVADQWYHAVFVRDVATDKLYLYLNGTSDATGVTDTTTTTLANTYNFMVGRWEYYNLYFDGLIDDVRVYNRALSAGEVEDLYEEGLSNDKAFSPNPFNGATGVYPNVIFSWSPGENVASHDVYFGTDYNDVNDANTSSAEYKGNFDVNSWDPCGLELATTYYWRIDEVNDSNLWKGNVWSFETIGPTIGLSATYFNFDANEGGANPDGQILGISNIGIETLNWEITEDCSWLSVEPTSGSSTGEINEVALSVDISGLTGGVYDCNLIITDPCALNSPQMVAVSLNVTGPIIELSATDFNFDANEGGASPAEQTLAIGNSGAGVLNWEIEEDCDWLSVEPSSGSSTGEADDVTISVDISGLEGGVYDCNLIITDPNAENSPCIVNVTLDLTDIWRDYIVFPDDPLTSEVIFESDPRWVKFTIKLDDPCTVYFQNSKLYPFHYHFATEWLEPFIGMSVPEYFDVALYDVNQQVSLGAVILPPMAGEPPVPEFLEYGIQFVRYDPYTKEEIASMFNVVKNSVVSDPCVTAYYFPVYEQQQVANENQAWFESQGIPIGSIAQWIEGNICYSAGWALGELKYFPGDEIQSAYLNGDLLPEDILLTDGVPAEVPFVAGIITLSPSTPSSHVAILAKTYGIPFVYLAADLDVEKVWQLVDELVLLCVQESGGVCSVQLRDAVAYFTAEELETIAAMKTVMPIDISPMVAYGDYSANTTGLLPEDIKHFGGKASNYGMLRTSIPDNSPVAAALSFDVWSEFMDQALTPSDSVIIEPYGHVVFWADDQPEQGVKHIGFKLSAGGEEIGLFDVDGGLIDGLSFGVQTMDVSYGRTPDGGDVWDFFYSGDISPNSANPGGAGITGLGLLINEFMADNDNIAADEYSEYDDWIEIYNSGSTAVDLGGMYLTDDLSEPSKWMISVGISGSTLGEEIANRLAGYTYPVSDLGALSADLAAIRNIITNPNITHFSQQLEDAIIAALQDANYGFDPNGKIRFRSSTNVEDTEQFVGAGLYDSYSGCLADDLDGDEDGPCRCDPNESNERGVFRAIRKVLASFYNDNAYLERLRRDVNEQEVGMAMLVHHSFPDELELANGVATMEKKLSPAHWDIKLVTQKGATPVTNPEEGALPEEVSVYAEAGGGMAMTLIRQSNLVVLGETVMEWQADYNDLTDLLVAAAEEFEAVTGKTTYILDFEYKKVAPGGAAIPAGGIEVDQIREIPPIDTVSSTCPSFNYSCFCDFWNISREHVYEDPATGISIESSYCLYCPPDMICKIYMLNSWCRTVIRGYTTKPIVLVSFLSQSYLGGHHNWCEELVFTPHLEPGMDQCLLNELRAKDIREIYLAGLTYCGTPFHGTTGFGSEPYYLGDLDWDGGVGLADFASFAQRWLNSDCGFCGGADLDCDEEVGYEDLEMFIDNWLEGI